MKILCVIDHLGGGGAQRQMAMLARGLAARGHQVDLFVYYPRFDFFAAGLREAGVRMIEFGGTGGFSAATLRALRAVVAGGGHDVMLSFLDTPNVYSELARLLTGLRLPLVVSERNSYLADTSPRAARVKRALYVLASHVVTNNLTQRDWLRRKFWLRDKVSCIYNGIDLDAYPPCPPRAGDAGLELVGVGRISPQKNLEGLIGALEWLDAQGLPMPRISWVGRDDSGTVGAQYRARLDGLLARAPRVAAQWRWLGERRDVSALLCGHDALIHPAHFEGLPNVVCEAFSAARPVLLSAVCDHPELAGGGERALLFDQKDPAAIARALLEFTAMPAERRARMGAAGREYAQRRLASAVMVTEYERLLMRVSGQGGSA